MTMYRYDSTEMTTQYSPLGDDMRFIKRHKGEPLPHFGGLEQTPPR
jgi:hypothetical protein